MDTVALLTGIPVRRKDWGAALAGHAAGDAEATRRLRRAAEDPLDAAVGAALRAFLSMPNEDMKYVAGELGRL